MEDFIKVSAPGRICLFGEHQDYLNLPVIACAISLRISIEGRRRSDSTVAIDLPDIRQEKSFKISNEVVKAAPEDYFSSVLNVLLRKGLTFSKGFDCQVTGNIPISAGTSSSSALVVAWVNFLSLMSDQRVQLSATEIAQWAYEAEVLEFSGQGGRMDQFASAVGGTLLVDSWPEARLETMRPKLESFVLGDSLEAKETQTVLGRVKRRILGVEKILQAQDADFSLSNADVESIRSCTRSLTVDEYKLLHGTVRNHAITLEARECLGKSMIEHQKIGELLTEHQSILRDILGISTPKIDRMIAAALSAGAYGAKINGSGGGGCMFAYTGQDSSSVVEAIERAGGKAYVIRIADGVRAEICL